MGRMETWDAIRARRNTRHYSDRPIDVEDLDRIAEAGRRAPSSMNEQPWDFIIVAERERLLQMADLWQYGSHIGGAAAAVAFLSPTSTDPEAREIFVCCVGRAAMSMMVTAADLGIGSCHSSIGDQEAARSVLGFPDDRECVVLLSLRYPHTPAAPLQATDPRPPTVVR